MCKEKNMGQALPYGIIFDMDGLMLESEELWSEVDRCVVAEYGLEFNPSFKHLFMGCEKIESARKFCDLYGLSESPDVIAQKRNKLARKFYREGVKLMPGLTQLVCSLRDWGKPLAVATSADHAIVTIVMARFDIFTQFEAIVCADEVKKGKPAPDLFLEAARRLDVPARSALVLEDSPNGITAALSAGMKVIGVPNPAVKRETVEQATVLVEKLSHISTDLIARLYESC